MAAQKLNVPAADLTTADGMVRPKAGGTGIKLADLLAGKSFHLKLDPKAPLKAITPSSASRCRGRLSSLELCGECGELANLIKKDSQALRRLLLRLGTASSPA